MTLKSTSFRFQAPLILAAIILAAIFALPIGVAQDQDSAFQTGPTIKGFGKIASVNSDVPIPDDIEFKVRFDVDRKARAGSINGTFDSAARFINLHVANGVPLERIQIAIVVHGGASIDVTRQDFFGQVEEGGNNGSASALESLQKCGVRFYLCGQSAAYHGIENKDLLPEVKMTLSAMTMHALLDREGFSLNPF